MPEVPPFITPPAEPAAPPPLVVAPSWTAPRPEAYDRLFERRVVFVRGPLDEHAATDLCAELMALDGASAEPVSVLVNSPGGPLPAIVPVLDTLSLMRAPVDTTCLGRALGTAAVLVAAGTGTRRAGPRSRLSLRIGSEASISGTASEMARSVELWLRQRDDLVELLAARTGAPADELRRQLDDGADLEPVAALALGLLDTLEPA
jgi:ATP-dependent Clp protease protease subunit